MMIIADIDYLQPISETSAIHLSGGYRRTSRRAALAIADFFATAVSHSNFINAVVDNKAVTDADGLSSASSSVKVISSIAPGENGVAIASASTTAAVVPTNNTTVLPILENPSEAEIK